MTVVATQQKARRPAGRMTVRQREQAFADIQLHLRASPSISAAQALEASYAYTALRAAQLAESKSKSTVEIYNTVTVLADRLLNRITALEAEIDALRGGEPGSSKSQDRVRHRPSARSLPQAKAQKSLRLSLVGDIRRDRVQSLIDRIKEAPPDTPLRVTIDSRGGNLNAAFDLADVIGRHRGDTHCHALQDCSSASVVVMLSARKRTAEPGCSFVLHRPSLARRPSVLADERIEGMLDNSAHSMARMLASRTGTDAEVFRPMMATARGRRLDSATAVELGIIHALTPRKGKSR